MKVRIWYPQLDVYDCIRRIVFILLDVKQPLHLERLYILDFFLANPPLLHKITMKQQTRANFRALDISRPEKMFVTYPAAQLLFHKMEPTQKQAIHAMAGKNILSISELRRGVASLTEIGNSIISGGISDLITPNEKKIVHFLTSEFSKNSEGGIADLRASTGLRRAG